MATLKGSIIVEPACSIFSRTSKVYRLLAQKDGESCLAIGKNERLNEINS